MTATRSATSEDVIDGPPPGEDAAVSEDQVEAPTRDRLRWAASAVALVGVIALVIGALSWYRAAHDDGLAAARTRDQALVAASTGIATLNTLDYRDVDGGLKRWRATTTGTLRDQLSKAGAKDVQLLAEQQKVTTGKVLEAAVTDLDPERGTATAIAAVEITVRGTTGEPTIKRNRYTANLVRVDGRWLLDTLSQLPVDVS